MEGVIEASEGFSDGSTDHIDGDVVLSTILLLGLEVVLLEGVIVDFSVGTLVSSKGLMLGLDFNKSSLGSVDEYSEGGLVVTLCPDDGISEENEEVSDGFREGFEDGYNVEEGPSAG